MDHFDKLKDILAAIEKDVQTDAMNVKDKAFIAVSIRHKWVGQLINTKVELKRLTNKKKLLEKETFAKMQRENPVSFTKKQFDGMVATSGTFSEIDDAIEFLELKIELLERTEKNLSQWTYDIKNAVEIIKMETT